MQFLQDWPKDKKITAHLIFCLKTEKIWLTELYHAALEGWTIFLCRCSLGCTSKESCQLADMKYAIFSSTGCKTKNLLRSKLFLSIVFMEGIGLLIKEGIRLLIMKGIGLLIMKGMIIDLERNRVIDQERNRVIE